MPKHRKRFNPGDRRCWARAEKAGAVGICSEVTKRLLEYIADQDEAEERISNGVYASLKDAMLEQLREIPLRELLVSRSLYQPLESAKIKDVGELAKWSRGELELVYKIGPTRAQQIAQAMANIGLPLPE